MNRKESKKPKTTGEMKTITGEMKTISREMKTISGEMKTITGEMKTITGEMKTISGEMKTISGEMKTVSGEMKTISGEMKISNLLCLPVESPRLEGTLIYSRQVVFRHTIFSKALKSVKPEMLRPAFFHGIKINKNKQTIKKKVMKRTLKFSIVSVAGIVCCASAIVASLSDASILNGVTVSSTPLLYASFGGLIFALAFSLAAVPESVLANIRKWHGSIDEQFDNIDNLVNTVEAHSPGWMMPVELLTQLTDNRDQLQQLINKCRSNSGSASDRTVRNSLLKSTVGLCLTQVKAWSYTEYYAGVMSADDVHLLGFLLPGETGGHHSRTEASDALAEVKVTVINEDFIRVVIDQSVGENAARVKHGWPSGVRQALIVIVASDGKTEVLRHLTTRQHTDIRMPEGSRGKLFIAKAAFLKHIDDEPRFGTEPTFSMPLTTEDLTSILDRQHHEEFEEQIREVEQHRQEVEELK